MKLLLAIIFTITLSSTAFAACVGSGSNGACADVTIDILYLTEDGSIHFGTSGSESNLSPACTASGSGGKYITLLNSHLLRDQIYSLLLTSHVNRNPIDIVTNANVSTNACEVKYVVSYQ